MRNGGATVTVLTQPVAARHAGAARSWRRREQKTGGLPSAYEGLVHPLHATEQLQPASLVPAATELRLAPLRLLATGRSR